MKTVCRRKAFTLVEVLVVSGMMSVLAVVIASTWAGVGRPIAGVIAHSRLLQEMEMAAVSLAHDLGGSLASSEGRLGGKTQYRFVGWMQRSGSQLWLCFDGGSNPNGIADWTAPDTVIVYLVESHKLARWDQTANTTFPVAQYVDKMELSIAGNDLRIQLTFTNRELTRTATFIARAP